MDDWKKLLDYNFSSSYHNFAFGFMRQGPAARQAGAGHSGRIPNSWNEAGLMDFSSYNPGIAPGYYAANLANALGDSPPVSHGQHVVNGSCQYQGTGVVYVGDAQSSRVVLSAPQQTAYGDQGGGGVRRAPSETHSDSEARTSPDSLTSGSSGDGNLTQVDPTTWVRKATEYEVSGRAPVVSQDVPNCLIEEPRPLAVADRSITTDYPQVPIPAQKNPNETKGKVRPSFSERQMNVLVQRFSVQRYLTPAEMKGLAEMIGLTYKQVKTWFQNRRMKLRRYQKDNSWMCDGFNANKDVPVPGNMYNNVPSHVRPPHPKEQCNQHMMDATCMNTAPQHLAFYLAAMRNAAGPVGYPAWSSSTSQSAVSPRPQVDAWAMPQGVGHYEYNPNAFNPVATHGAIFENQDGQPANGSGYMGGVNNVGQ